MIWLDYRGAATPAGRSVATPTIGGHAYELWLEESTGRDANGVGWPLLTFKSLPVEHAGVLPLHELVRYLVAAKLLSSSEYLASIEFGNEIVGGRGTTWVTDLRVEPAP